MSDKVEASQKTVKEQIVEALAILEHNQWSHWIKYQDRLFNDEEAGYDVWYRWRELAKTKYADLTEEQKESDREWARASFKIVSKGLVDELKKQAIDRNDIDEEWENSGCESWEELEKLRKKKFVSLVGVLEVLR